RARGDGSNLAGTRASRRARTLRGASSHGRGQAAIRRVRRGGRASRGAPCGAGADVKQLVQSMRTGAVQVLDVAPPRLAGPGVLVQTAASLVSAGTERAALEFAKGSLVGKARARPDLVKQVLDKVRRDGLLRTATVALERLDRPVAP